MERIYHSFRKMWADQEDADPRYRASEAWQKILDKAYFPLVVAIREDNIADFGHFLSNFGTVAASLGFEGQGMIAAYSKSSLKKRYMMNEMFLKPFRTWNWFYGNRKAPSALSSPSFGNQPYAELIDHDGVRCDINCFFNEIYGSMLAGLVKDLKRPVVADLGGGSGKTAEFLLRNLKRFGYVNFDLPQVVTIAAYFLMMAYPDKSVLL